MSNPDLSAVLQTLSTFSQTQTQQKPPPSNSTSTSTSTATSKPPSSSSLSHSSSSSQSKPSNPSQITTWPSALRHIMHHQNAHNHAHFTAHIRRLVTTQHAQERKWWEEREALVRRQAARGERKRELERVLQSVGAAAAATTTTTTATDSKSGSDQQTAENAVELAYHDAKVYKAATDLSRTTAAELRRLGVPFFAIDESLVSTDTNHVTEGKISKQELAVLKRRMLELLQDLCRD